MYIFVYCINKVYNNNIIKLSEFGFYKSIFNCTSNPNRDLCVMTKDPEWVAPEILKDKKLPPNYSFEYYDIYAYGMLIFEIFTRQYHYPDMNSFIVGYKVQIYIYLYYINVYFLII